MSVPTTTGDIYEVRLRGMHDNQQVMSVLHYIYDPHGETITVEGACEGLNNALKTADDLMNKYYIVLNHEYVGEQTEIQRIYPDRSVYYSFDPFGANGLSEGDGLPPGNSVAVTKRSDLAGRSKVGGVRVPAVSVGDVVEGRLTELAATGYGNFALKLLVHQPIGFGDAEMLPIILHRASPILSAPLTQVLVQTAVRTMSRRVLGRGI